MVSDANSLNGHPEQVYKLDEASLPSSSRPPKVIILWGHKKVRYQCLGSKSHFWVPGSEEQKVSKLEKDQKLLLSAMKKKTSVLTETWKASRKPMYQNETTAYAARDIFPPFSI